MCRRWLLKRKRAARTGSFGRPSRRGQGLRAGPGLPAPGRAGGDAASPAGDPRRLCVPAGGARERRQQTRPAEPPPFPGDGGADWWGRRLAIGPQVPLGGGGRERGRVYVEGICGGSGASGAQALGERGRRVGRWPSLGGRRRQRPGTHIRLSRQLRLPAGGSRSGCPCQRRRWLAPAMLCYVTRPDAVVMEVEVEAKANGEDCLNQVRGCAALFTPPPAGNG